MTTNEPPKRDESTQNAENVRNALFAADLKRLVRAAQDGDNEITDELRSRHTTD